MITADLVVALVLGALVFVHDRSDVWIIYVVTFVYGASGYLFTSAQSALLTQMLPRIASPTRTRCSRPQARARGLEHRVRVGEAIARAASG